MVIKLTTDFGRLGYTESMPRILDGTLLDLLIQNPLTNSDAAVADVDTRTRDELSDLCVAFPAE
jgi:hypothetical protein